MSELPAAVVELLEGSPDAAVILDRDRKILHFNRAYQGLTGMGWRKLSKAVDAGARCLDVFALEICRENCVGCRAAEAGRSIRVDEIESVDTDEPMTFIVTASPLAGGYIFETYRDVTADVRMQQRIKDMLERERQANISLEEKVAKRTEELRQAQGQLVLQEKLSALGRLVAGIAHELNNPINFVYGNVDFLDEYVENLISLVKWVDEQQELPEEIRSAFETMKEELGYDYMVTDSAKLIESIREGAERSATIVRDLKVFSRTGAGEMREACMVTGVETTLNLIAPTLRHRITVERDFEQGLPKVLCNAGHINQVFMNILTNAAQAIEGEGTISIRIRKLVEDGDHVEVSVRDSGPGISEEDMAKIMDPFFTTKPVGEGTGLGLSISQSIIRKHGGQLRCDSKLGEGATFTVSLPVTPPDEPAGEGTENAHG